MNVLELDRKLLKQIAEKCPLTYQALFARKYLVPDYRRGDYDSMEFADYMSFERMLAWATANANPRDEVYRCALATVLGTLHYGRPTYYLERELGEALLRTELLSDLTTGDINWRWPAFRIVLPSYLLAVQREETVRWLTYFEVADCAPDRMITAPVAIAREVDLLATRMNGESLSARFLERAAFGYQERGIIVSTALNRPESSDSHQTIYGVTKPWGSYRIRDYEAITGDLVSPFSQDDADKKLINRLEHLVMSVLLFLSATPLEYKSERILRPQSIRHLTPSLMEAQFVGASGLRATPRTHAESLARMSPEGVTGRHVSAHWVCGHFKRQVFGTGRAERKLIWIRPYQTYDQV